jgi:hypothetical protein
MTTHSVSDVLVGFSRNMADQEEAWLERVCRSLDMSPEDLAQLYEIERQPLETVQGDGNSIRFRRKVRLVRRSTQ